MKKHLFLGSLGALLALASCSNDYTNTWPANYTVFNLITDSDGTSTLTPGNYMISRTVTHESNTGYIEVSNLQINPDAPLSFSTVEQSYTTDSYNLFSYFKNVKSNTVNLNNANFLATKYFYWPQNTQYVLPLNYEMLIAQYNIGDNYNVKTFAPLTYFMGTTNTSFPYQGEMMTNTTDKIGYFLAIGYNEDKEATATLTMYNAKFSGVEAEPTKDVILEDLKVTCSAGKIIVSGESIVPSMIEGGSLTPVPQYTFKTIEFTTTNADLTQCQIDYTIAASQMGMEVEYKGSFTGSYIADLGGE
ncbi:MAG: hypothetical protein J1D77_01380 [Muribaculaceae bacterium]|nr:hypothetical protein [Muribaculaceae bacterium]